MGKRIPSKEVINYIEEWINYLKIVEPNNKLKRRILKDFIITYKKGEIEDGD